MLMFPDRRTWADHETQTHRRSWQCHLCQSERFGSKDSFQSHITGRHADMARSTQLEAFIETCSRPIERQLAAGCDFCDWSTKLKSLSENSSMTEGEDIHVTISQFMKHIARHLEQVALFALPRMQIAEGDSAAADIGLRSSEGSSRVLVLPLRESILVSIERLLT